MDSPVWVFGYGSLLWKPGFEFTRTHVGHIKGFTRKFWQGNDVHRGSPGQLGRVVTLVREKESVVWGRAFLLKDVATARSYLDHREQSLGGYSTLEMDFFPNCDGQESPPISVLVYVALPSNPHYLGPASSSQIASEIIVAEGCNGHNVEYLAKLSAFMKLHVDHNDYHIDELDREVRHLLRKQSADSLLEFFDIAIATFPKFEMKQVDASNSVNDQVDSDHESESSSSDSVSDPQNNSAAFFTKESLFNENFESGFYTMRTYNLSQEKSPIRNALALRAISPSVSTRRTS